MRYLTILVLALVGCSSKFDDCIDKEKEIYRQHHPTASYGLINSKYSEFERSCSQYKGR